MNEAELVVSECSRIAGIGVSMYADYGPAQRLYTPRGYVPDGRGLISGGIPSYAGMPSRWTTGSSST
jgi:hypothetical protein